MSDSDPFSGIHLSPPPPPPAEINPDDLSPSRIFALALTEYDNIYQPALRSVANLVASRITSLTESQIVRLSDDKIGRLIETELSRLSDDEKFCLLKAEISKIFDGTGDAVLSSLATGFTTIHEKLVHDFADFVERNKTAIMIIDGFFYVGFVILGILIYYKIKEWIYQISTFVQKSLSRLPPLGSVIVPIQRSLSRLPPLRRAVMVPANTTQRIYQIATCIQEIQGVSRLPPFRRVVIVPSNNAQLLHQILPSSKHDVPVTSNAAQQEQPKLSERCLNLSKYSRTDVQGLKGIGETYTREAYTVFRQEVEQHQQSTSRAIVPSTRSTVDDSKSLS